MFALLGAAPTLRVFMSCTDIDIDDSAIWENKVRQRVDMPSGDKHVMFCYTKYAEVVGYAPAKVVEYDTGFFARLHTKAFPGEGVTTRAQRASM